MSVEFPIEQQNEIAAAMARSRLRDRSRVFREVFQGPQGQLILASLKQKFSHDLPPNILGLDGHTDPYQTWRRLGHFDVLEYITQQINWKESDHVDPSPSSP
jgi:hypothetical protein